MHILASTKVTHERRHKQAHMQIKKNISKHTHTYNSQSKHIQTKTHKQRHTQTETDSYTHTQILIPSGMTQNTTRHIYKATPIYNYVLIYTGTNI